MIYKLAYNSNNRVRGNVEKNECFNLRNTPKYFTATGKRLNLLKQNREAK